MTGDVVDESGRRVAGVEAAAGPTMTSVPLRVIEAWTQNATRVRSHRWERQPELEVDITPDWWTERAELGHVAIDKPAEAGVEEIPTVAPDDPPVGEGPLYEPMRQNARELIPVWVPWGIENSQNWWDAGPFGIVHEEDGSHRVFVTTYDWEKRALAHNKTFPLETLRVAAISLLVYCEAQESKTA